MDSDDIIFFFSSRRRHTRWPRDWSSDVCSSDLTSKSMSQKWGSVRLLRVVAQIATNQYPSNSRSEERRVGKECRSRWWAYHEKKKESEELKRKNGKERRKRKQRSRF